MFTFPLLYSRIAPTPKGREFSPEIILSHFEVDLDGLLQREIRKHGPFKNANFLVKEVVSRQNGSVYTSNGPHQYIPLGRGDPTFMV